MREKCWLPLAAGDDDHLGTSPGVKFKLMLNQHDAAHAHL
jgi:hypothetical protein